MRADITTETDETNRAMQRYESKSIPLLVIIPSATPDDPIILRDVYTREKLQAKLREAVTRNQEAKPAKSAQAKQTVLN